MKASTKIMMVAIVPIIFLAVAALLTFTFGNNAVKKIVTTEVDTQIGDEIKSMTLNVYRMCDIRYKTTIAKVSTDLNAARTTFHNKGEVALEKEKTIPWNAINQYTQTQSTVNLPGFYIGDQWLGQNSDPKKSSFLIDEICKITNSTCTIFQRMNDAGDMLRVSTNIITKNGLRAIGTYIPHYQADGTENTVVSSVLKGETFYGKAYVVDSWYMTAYEPICSKSGKIIGMLYVGVPLDEGAILEKAIKEITVGKTGYVYVLGGSGQQKGNYIISCKGKRDGENIWNAKDSDGNLFIQEIINKTTGKENGEVDIFRYPWKNEGEAKARNKIAAVTYFKQWDWVIGSGAYEEDFMDMKSNIDMQLSIMAQWFIGIVIGVSIMAIIIGIWTSRNISNPITRIIQALTSSAEQTTAAAGQISSASQQLAEGATEQAASLEETSSALEEMASMTRQNADNAASADKMMAESKTQVSRGAEAVSNMSMAMSEINGSSDKISRIIKTIEEIAFQTNLLALNAAVEAARAGDAGKGFAVVADEVRNLAQRSAQAARDTAELIRGTLERVKKGSLIVENLEKSFVMVEKSSGKVADLVSEISAASNEQAQGVDQVNTAVAQMDKITQGNAANAEESASASEELSAQAEQLNAMVSELRLLVNGY
jgi:methyl-accepting chemotaxis protein